MTDTQPPRAWWRRRGVLAALLAGAAVLVVVLVWFQPQTLLFDTVVDDEFPAADPDGDDADVEVADPAASADDSDEPNPDAAAEGSNEPSGDAAAEPDEPDDEATDTEDAEVTDGPVALASGRFESRNRYTVTGDATIHEVDGERVLRLEDFESTNGPDLYVYLTAADHADDDETLDQDVVDLGELRGNVGDQNYPVDADVDLDHYDTVVIWCERFSTSFGAADLEPA